MARLKSLFMIISPTKGPDDRDFAGQIETGRVLPGASGDYSKFLSELGQPIINLSYRAPEYANLLKLNVQAVRNFRRAASLTTFMQQEYAQGLDVRSISIPLYDAPDNLSVNVIDAPATMQANDGMTEERLSELWVKNTEGNHSNNVKQLAKVLKDLEYLCQ